MNINSNLSTCSKLFKINSVKSMSFLAKSIASHSTVGDIICLKGNLGVGKTTFARYFISSIANKKENVVSPTFNLLIVYPYANYTVWHYDLFRIKDKEEIWDIGFQDAVKEGITLIEWPENMGSYIPNNRLDLNISLNPNESEERLIDCVGYGNWIQRVSLISNE